MRYLWYLCTKHESMCNVTSKQCICTLWGKYTVAVGVLSWFATDIRMFSRDMMLDSTITEEYHAPEGSSHFTPPQSSIALTSSLRCAVLRWVLCFGSIGNFIHYVCSCRTHWPRGLKRESAAARFLGFGFRVQLGCGYFSFVSVACLSGRGHCVGLISRPEESYRLWCIQ
jgi:hypothetical protein